MYLSVIALELWPAERHAEADQAVAQVLEHMRSQGITAEGEAPYGRPEEEIVATAVAKNADLIVTGSHGRTGLEPVLLGSTSERIINNTTCAVLVVKAG